MLEIWGNSEKSTIKYTWALNIFGVSQITEVNRYFVLIYIFSSISPIQYSW